MSIKVEGNWAKGLAFDVHTLSSTYLGTDEFGHDRWESVRSEMGELLYRLKYKQDRSVLPEMMKLLEKIKGIETFDYIIPIPPSDASRNFQPVTEIATAIGNKHGVKVLKDVLKKRSGGLQLKNVDDPEEREKLLKESLSITDEGAVAGRKVLLIDDLYRSGATLRAATELLYDEGKAEKVSVLTMTKTRSNR